MGRRRAFSHQSSARYAPPSCARQRVLDALPPHPAFFGRAPLHYLSDAPPGDVRLRSLRSPYSSSFCVRQKEYYTLPLHARQIQTFCGCPKERGECGATAGRRREHCERSVTMLLSIVSFWNQMEIITTPAASEAVGGPSQLDRVPADGGISSGQRARGGARPPSVGRRDGRAPPLRSPPGRTGPPLPPTRLARGLLRRVFRLRLLVLVVFAGKTRMKAGKKRRTRCLTT